MVDYFLFDLRQGYCDYYASAMIVFARSRGLPARLAVGYASGEYDPVSDQFLVTEADAHSWPEIYFPEYGWIPFEPTAAQPRTVFDSHQALATTPSDASLSAELTSLRWARTLRLAGQISLPFLIAGRHCSFFSGGDESAGCDDRPRIPGRWLISAWNPGASAWV